MRKLFTQLSLYALFCVMGLQIVYGGVIERKPGHLDNNVAPGTDLTLTFANPLAQGDNYSGAVIRLYKVGAPDVIADAVTLPSSRFVINGSSVAIDIQATMVDGASYYVVIPSGVVKEMNPDGTTTSFPGYLANAWQFTIGDYTAPKLIANNALSPADGATNVGSLLATGNVKTSNFSLIFTEAVKGVAGKYIKIYNADGSVHEMINAGSYTTASSVVSFVTTNLREKTAYTILVDAGAFVDNSENENPFAGISSNTQWNVTTRDYTPAVMADGYPAFGNITNNSIGLKVKLDEAADVYFLAYTKAVTEIPGFVAPTAIDIKAANKKVEAANAGTEYTYSYNSLSEGVEYVFYYVSENKAKHFAANDPLTSAVGKTDTKYTLDVTKPIVWVYSPVQDASGVPQYLNAGTGPNEGTLSLQFNENVKAGAGNVIVKKSSDNSTVETVDITSGAVSFKKATGSPDGSTDLVVIKLATKLESATMYYITIADGVITDKTGNKYVGINTSTFWKFTVKDVVAPTVAFSAPASTTHNVLASAEPVVLTFSENIYSDATGTAPMTNATAAASVRVERNNADVTSAFTVSTSLGNKITIAPTATWIENSTYVVFLLKDKVFDLAGNKISEIITKSYKTDSYVSPTAGSWTSSPINPNSNIEFVFSEPVQLLGGGAVTSDNVGSLITLTVSGGAPVPFVATYNTGTRRVTVNPVSDLISGTSYTINLSNGYQDYNLINGANQGTAYTVNYAVRDKDAPTITFDFVKTNVPTVAADADLVIKFSENVFTVDISHITLREGDANGPVVPAVIAISANPVFTVNPVSNLKEGTTYYLAFANGVVNDAAAGGPNWNVGANTTFVTKTTPVLSSTTPADNATNVSKNTNAVQLVYSENVKLNPGYVSTFPALDVDNDGLTPAIPVAVQVVNAANEVVAYTPAINLVFVGNTVSIPLYWTTGYPYSITQFASSASYDVLVDGGLILSANNNAAAAITIDKLDFKIEDYTIPVISSLTAPARLSAADMAKALEINFAGDKVKKGIGTISIQRVDILSQPVEVIDINSTAVGINNDANKVTVNHTAFKPSLPGTTVIYKVTMSEGAITDLAGNKNAGLKNLGTAVPALAPGGELIVPSDGEWFFATALNAAPVWDANNSTPAVGADNVLLTSNLVIAFNETISKDDLTKKVTVRTSAGVVQEYAMSESNVTVSGKNILVTLQTLTADVDYFVTLEAGAVKDTDGASNAAITYTDVNTYDWIFSTYNANGPIAEFIVDGVKSTSTTPNWTKVNRNSNIVINFDEEIRKTDNSAITSVDIPQNIVTLSSGTGVIPSYTANISSDKKTITINASSFTVPLSSITTYTITVAGIEDNQNNPFTGGSFDFKVNDYDAPIGTIAGLGAKIIQNHKGTEIKVEFDYDENATAYYQLLGQNDATPSVASLLANGIPVSVNKDADPRTSVVIPTSSQTNYKLVVVAADLVYATAQSAVEVHTLLTADITDPMVVEYVNNGKADVDPANPFELKLKFADKVQAGSGNLYVYDSNNVLIGTYGTGAIVLTNSDKDVTVTIAGATLATNKSYYVVVDKGFVTDITATLPVPNVGSSPAKSVNKFAGFSDNATYTFKTKDTNPPVASGVTPFDKTAGTGVNTGWSEVKANGNSNIVVTFNEPIQLGSQAGAGDIEIWKPGLSEINEIILATSSQVVISGNQMIIDPSITFVDGAQNYTVSINPGTVKDVAGNNNTLIRWQFDVNDVTPPSVKFLVGPGGDAITKAPVNVNTDIYVEFSENIRLLDNSSIITEDLDTLVTLVNASNVRIPFVSKWVTANSFTIDPVQDLKSDMSYTLSFGSVFEDGSNNAVPAQSVTFNTKITDSPTVMFDPANGAKDVEVGKTITITFSRGVVQEDPTGFVADGFFSALENSELKDYLMLKTSTGADIAYTATINAGKNTITIDPVIDLGSESKIWLTFDPLGISGGVSNGAGGLVADLVDSLNNDVKVKVADVKAVFGNGGVVEFTVIDNVAPVLAGTKYTPNDAGYLMADKKLTAEFNEKVKAGTGMIKIYQKGGVLIETIDAATLTTKSDNEKIIEINPVLARANNTEYYVIIPAGAIVDKSPLANAFAGTVDFTSWTYATADSQNPVVVDLSPANGATDVYLYQDLVVTFDKKVDYGTGNIAIYKQGGDAFDLLRVSPTEYRVEIGPTGLYVKIDFIRTLDPETVYYVEMEPGTFVNAKNTDAKFAGIMDNNTWKFSTEITNAPKLVETLPADDAVDVSTKTALTMTFDMDVEKGSGYVSVVETSTGALIEKVNIDNAIISGATVTVNLTNDLLFSKSYHVIVDAGAVTNTLPSKVGYAGISTPLDWNFSTILFTCPITEVSATLVEQMECSAVVNIMVESANMDYVVTVNGDTVPVGEITLEAGSYTIIASATKGVCSDTTTFEVITVPVVRDTTVATYFGEEVAFVDAEAGVDTMLSVGEHTFVYEYMMCERTLNVTVVEELCRPIEVVATVVEQMECAAKIDIAVTTEGKDYIILVNGVETPEGEVELAAGIHEIITSYAMGECADTTMYEVITVPVVRDTIVSTYYNEAVNFVDVEAGLDTMLVAGEYSFVYEYTTCERTLNVTVVEDLCKPIMVVTTVVKQMECSAIVNISVTTEVNDYILTLNGDTITGGDVELEAGVYTIVASYEEGVCKDTKTLTVVSVPVVKNETVETYNGEAVHYVNEEAGVDKMLMAGVHTFTYDYEGCTRTLIVTVVGVMRTPTIAEIQGETDNSPLAGKTVKVVATVTGVAPGEGFFIQDASAAWSGIWVEYSAATFQGIQIGNGVSVIGEVAEVANVTSLINVTMDFVPPMVAIVPVMMTSPDITAEMYESVLIKFDGIRATAADSGNGEWNIYYVAGQNIVVNDWLYDSNPVADHYYDVTGIVNGRLDNFKLEPRIEPDVKDLTLTPVDIIEEIAFKVYPNPFRDQITIDNNEKLTRVVISNIAGQRVIDIEYPTREIRTANLVSGIYIISLYTEDGIAKTERMIKR